MLIDNDGSIHKFPRTTVAKVLDEMLGSFHESWRERMYLLDVVIKAVSNEDRRKLGLKGTALAYPMLGELPYKPNPNECMIDFIIYEAMRKSVTLYRQELYHVFGGQKNVQENGVSINQLEAYLRARNDVNSYAINEFNTVFSTVQCTREPKFYIVFKVNNEHVYPIFDEAIKHKVAHTKKLELGDCKMIVDYSDVVAWKIDSETDLAKPPAGKAILVDTDDLGQLILMITQQTNALVWNVMIPEGSKPKAVTFEHPVTHQLIIAAKDWEKRHAVCAELASLKCLPLLWANQSWGSMSRTLFELKFGKLKPSEYSPEYMKILKHTVLRPLKGRTCTAVKPDATPESIDIRRQHTSTLLNYAGQYPRYVYTDETRPCTVDEELVVGDYFVSEDFTMCKGNELAQSGWYPHEFIRVALERKLIDREIVTHVMPASHFYDSAPIREHAKWVYEKFPSESKNMLNHHIGWWGKTVRRTTKQMTTNSWPTVCALIYEDPEHIQLTNLGDLIHLRKYSEVARSEGYAPLWRHVIAMSMLALDQMFNDLVGPDTVVYAWNTDSIKLSNPLGFKTGKNPGDYQIEAVCHIAKSMPVHENKPAFVPTARVWKELSAEDAKNEGCCYFSGMPGTGKTHTLVLRADALQKQGLTPIILTYTCQGRENLLARAKQLGLDIKVLHA